MTLSSGPIPAPEQHCFDYSSCDVDLLVVGAGPTGLTAAAEALRHGLSVRIIEKKATRDGFSKALVVHARTMETFSFMGIDREIRELGAPFAALNLHFNGGRRSVRVDLLNQPWGDTEFPYWLSVPQHDTESVLESHLGRLGGEIEWSRTLQSVADRGEFVEAVVGGDGGDGGEELIRARWVIGCDGGRSTVRDCAGISLKRTGEGTTFLLADAKTTSGLVEDEGYMYLAQEGLLILVPMPEPRRWRVIAQVPSGAGSQVPADAGRLDELILKRAGIVFGSHDVTWTSQFDLSHGVADHFSSGRIFVAGDAAHVHSPVGGQGLNTGVQDAYNLVWRLAESRLATSERARKLIQGYESERRGTAGPMVQGVARMTSIMTSPRHMARHFRSTVSPLVVSRAFVQAKLGRGVGMLNLSYAKRFARRASTPWGEGQRLPNPVLDTGERLYDHLRGTGYNWIVRDSGEGTPNEPDPDAAGWMGLPVFVMTHTVVQDSGRAGRKSRVVLVRPDRYIAAVGPDAASLHHALSRTDAVDPSEAASGMNNDITVVS